MPAGKYAFVLAIIVSLMMRCGTVSAPSQADGFIKGKIVLKDSLSLPGVMVVLEGTSFTIITDSAGNYLFFNVPEGDYTVGIYDFYYGKVVPIAGARVIAGDTVYIQDFVIKQGMSFYFDYFYLKSTIQIDSVRIFDAAGASLGYIFWNSYLINNSAEIPVAMISADSAGFSFLVTRSDLASSEQYAVEESTAIRHYGSMIYAGLPPKGRAKTGLFPLTGRDTFTIFVNGDSIQSFIVLNPSVVHDNYVHIFTGRTSLTPAPLVDSSFIPLTAGTGYGTLKNYYYAFFGTSCYEISINRYALEPVNWDLYLVNDSLHDTCYWGNPLPEWGNPFTTADNPFFYGGGSIADTGWQFEEIISQNLPSGTYSIYIRYYDGRLAGLAATPQLNIALGNSGSNAMLEKFYQVQAPRPMQKGETWCCGKLRIPEKQFVPSDTAGCIKKTPGLGKKA